MLVDASNFDVIAPQIIDEIRTADFIGLDGETEDSRRHAGSEHLLSLRSRDRQEVSRQTVVLRRQRTTMCGLSLYTQMSKDASTSISVMLTSEQAAVGEGDQVAGREVPRFHIG